MAGTGGKRTGAGRPRGALSRKTLEIAAKAVEKGITPLEVMLETMRDYWGQGEKAAACAIAKDAAPYMHARLQQIEQKSEITVQKAVSPDPLTPDEWAKTYGVPATH